MRKYVIALLAVITLGAGPAFAQSGSWAGASVGYPFGVGVHYGMEDLFAPNLDLRVGARVDFIGAFGITLSGDLLYNLDLADDPNVNVYTGGGVNAGFVSVLGASVFIVDLHGLFGAEYMFTPQWGAFGEAQLGFGMVGVSGLGGAGTAWGLTYGVRLGANYHF